MFWIFTGSRREKQFNFEQILIILRGVLYYKIRLRIWEICTLNSYITTSLCHDDFFLNNIRLVKLPSEKLERAQTENDLILKANPVGKRFFSPRYKEFMEHKGYCNFACGHGAINLLYCEYIYWGEYILFTEFKIYVL